MNCENCGAEVSRTAQFCSICGSAVTSVHQETRARDREIPPGQVNWRPRLPTNPLSVGLGILILLGLAAVVFLSSGSEQILYAVQDDGASNTNVNEISIISRDGKERNEIVYDRQGIRILNSPANDHRTFLSPNQRWLAFNEASSRGTSGMELVLASIQGGAPVLTVDAATCSYTNWCGFSPDGKRFAYTTMNERNNEMSTVVVDESGNELVSARDVIFADFYPDGRRLLVFEYDDRDQEITGLGSVTISSGDMNHIITISSDRFANFLPGLAPNGKQVYFFDEEELQVVGSEGGATQRIHDFGTPGWGIVSAHQDFLVVWAAGELILVDPDDNQSVRIDSDIGQVGNHIGEQNIAFSSDGDLLAYITQDTGGFSLYVVGTDGRNRQRISDDNNWLTFAFSPNGKQIAFVEGNQWNAPGQLYIASTDGSDRLRLDVDVWSFRFTEDGRRIIYSKVSDLSQGDPESEIYSIRVNGKGLELLQGVQDGLISILALVK